MMRIRIKIIFRVKLFFKLMLAILYFYQILIDGYKINKSVNQSINQSNSGSIKHA